MRTRLFAGAMSAVALLAAQTSVAPLATATPTTVDVSSSAMASPDPDKLCEGLKPVPAAKVPLCTHGPDPLSAFGGAERLNNAPASAAPAAAPDLCSDGGVTGKRIEVLYGVPQDRVSRFTDMLSTMRAVLLEADNNLDGSDAATIQHYRFLCENGVEITIRNVTLLPIGPDGSFTFVDYQSSLTNQVAFGLGPVDYVNNDRVYLTFVDQLGGAYPYGGQGSIYSDDNSDPDLNANNKYAKYSMTAYFDAHIVGHELGHNIGAVQHSAPHASGGYHCHDENDLMCYYDGGSYFLSGGQLTAPCPSVSPHVMDCGRDDYYYPGTPPDTNYLATHWNTADSPFLTPLKVTGQFSMTVSKIGAGAGTVTSSPAGVNCGMTCSANFFAGIPVTLTASPATGSTFAGWAGSCTGTSPTCTLSMSSARTATATFNTATAGTRYDDSAATYAGWKPYSDASGTYRASNVTNNTAEFSFSGTSLKWLTKRGPAHGKASVTIDGVAKGKFDLYATTSQSYTVSFTGLTSAAHKVIVKVLGTRNASATDTSVAVDGFAIGAVTTQEDNVKVSYDAWKGVSATAASGGSYRSGSVAGQTATFTFTGTGVDWLTYTGPGWGRAQVYIDGVDKGTVDLYATTAKAQTAKSYVGLSAGSHTMMIKVLGTKNAAATSTAVPVDAFVVR